MGVGKGLPVFAGDAGPMLHGDLEFLSAACVVGEVSVGLAALGEQSQGCVRFSFGLGQGIHQAFDLGVFSKGSYPNGGGDRSPLRG